MLKKKLNKYSFASDLDESSWQTGLSELSNSNVYCSWGWGCYKESLGWDIHRIRFSRTDKIDLVGCLQVQVKKFRYIKSRILLIQGGVFCDSSIFSDSFVFVTELHEYLSLRKYDLLAIDSADEEDRIVLGLLELGYKPIASSSGYTYMLDLCLSEEELMQGLSRNWRHNLKRSRKKGLHVRHVGSDKVPRERSLKKLAHMYGQLTERKKFSQAVDFQYFIPIATNDLNYKIVEVLSDNKVVAIRVGYISGKNGLDFLAASSAEAKKNYATYLALWELIMRSKNEGVERFDCGGIDPYNNTGVYYFKRGLGGTLNLPKLTWINSDSSLIKRLFANRMF